MRDDYDFEEDERGVNRMSNRKCPDCGRWGCWGGTEECAAAAENLMFSQPDEAHDTAMYGSDG